MMHVHELKDPSNVAAWPTYNVEHGPKPFQQLTMYVGFDNVYNEG